MFGFGRGFGFNAGAAQSKGGRGVADRYMVASNRFSFAVDWGTNGSGQVAATTMTGINGGNGTILARYASTRTKFSTPTWAPKGGRFLFANAALGIAGLFAGLFAPTIQRLEVRRAADASLVCAVTFGGATAYTLAAGERLWSDPIADLAALTTYYLDLYWTAPDFAAWPSVSPYMLVGERQNIHATTNLSLGSMGSGVTRDAVGGPFGAMCFVAKGWDGSSPVPMLFGDSILDNTNTAPWLASARGDNGFVQQALGDTATGAWPYGQFMRYSSSFSALTDDNLSSLGGINGLDWLADTFALLPGQGTHPPFNAIVCEHGRNNMSTSAILAGFVGSPSGVFYKAITKARGRWGTIPWVQLSTTPNTAEVAPAAPSYGYSEAVQNPIAGAANTWGGTISQWRDWIVANTGGLPAFLGLDSAAPCRGTSPTKWKPPVSGYASTLLDAVTTASTVLRLVDAPQIGETLMLEPGDATLYDSRPLIVQTVTAAGGGGWTVKCGNGRNGLAEAPDSYRPKPTKAHAIGAVVRATNSPDLLHPAPLLHAEMTAVIVAAKPQIAALAAAYAP